MDRNFDDYDRLGFNCDGTSQFGKQDVGLIRQDSFGMLGMDQYSMLSYENRQGGEISVNSRKFPNNNQNNFNPANQQQFRSTAFPQPPGIMEKPFKQDRPLFGRQEPTQCQNCRVGADNQYANRLRPNVESFERPKKRNTVDSMAVFDFPRNTVDSYNPNFADFGAIDTQQFVEKSVRYEEGETLSKIFGDQKDNSVYNANFNDKMSTRSRNKNNNVGNNYYQQLPDNNGLPRNQFSQRPTITKDEMYAPRQPQQGLFSNNQPQQGLFSNNQPQQMLKKRAPMKRYTDTEPIQNNVRKITNKEAQHYQNNKPKKIAPTIERNTKGGQIGIILLIFANEPVVTKDFEQLNSEEKFILQCILKRKFCIKIDSKWTNDKICEVTNKEQSNYKSKRLEENYKLVFKKSLKYLLNAFKKSQRLSRQKKSELERQFIEHHFKEVCDENGDSIETFLKSIGPGQNLFNPKTINSKYVQSISKSKLFVDDLIRYLYNEFMEDCKSTVEPKINKLIEKCQELSIQKDKGSDAIKYYVEENPKCKFPWSARENNNAKHSVLDLMNKLSD